MTMGTGVCLGEVGIFLLAGSQREILYIVVIKMKKIRISYINLKFIK